MSSIQWKDLTIGTNIDAEISASALCPEQTRISVRWAEMKSEKPALTISWSLPLYDIQYEWYPRCGKDRSLRIDWQNPEKTRISSGAPVFCFYNAAGRSRFTMALSDVLTEIDSSLGVREEDGTLACKVEIPLDKTGHTHEYQVTLYRSLADISFAESLRRVSLWWEKDCGLIPMPVPQEARLPLYSAWYSFHQATYAPAIEAECELAAKLGIKAVIVDDGWQTSDGSRGYAYCGDWQPTPVKIPDMAAHVKRVQDMGLKYILWYSVPYVGEYSDHWNEFKDKLVKYRADHHTGILDPRYPEVREYLISTYENALKNWNLDGFKLDFIDSFGTTTYAPAPKDGMDFVSLEDAIVCLMTGVMNRLKAIKPEILIEFRQSYIGPAMRTYGNMFRVGDCPADAINNRVGIIDLRLLSGNTAVHSDMLMWHKDDKVENAAHQVLSTIFGVMQLSVRLEDIPEDHLKMVTFWCDFMAKHRALLSAPLEVESPQNLYPLVRARLNEEEAIAVYDRHVVTLSDAAVTYLFNAAADPYLVIRCEQPRELTAEVFNCMGESVGTVNLPAARLHELTLPASGFAILK
ncbi:MAG: alpha-galactosidase [Clostridia bacterium]|nr:alpha-galactosidase [Clostridia bacterium]